VKFEDMMKSYQDPGGFYEKILYSYKDCCKSSLSCSNLHYN